MLVLRSGSLLGRKQNTRLRVRARAASAIEERSEVTTAVCYAKDAHILAININDNDIVATGKLRAPASKSSRARPIRGWLARR